MSQPHAPSSAPLRRRLAEGYERFEDDSLPTLGLEEELVLLDPDRLVPVDAIERALELLDGHVEAKPDLRACQLELVTRPFVAAADVARGLVSVRPPPLPRSAASCASPPPAQPPPATRARASPTCRATGRSRGEFPGYATRGTPNGLHVHVGLGGRDRALAVYNAARSYLPELAALAANSPILYGADTGLASKRLDVLGRLAQRHATLVRLVDAAHGLRGVGPPQRPDPGPLLPLVGSAPEPRHTGRSSSGSRTRRPRWPTPERWRPSASAWSCTSPSASTAASGCTVHEAQRISENRWRATQDGVRATLRRPRYR